MTAKLTLFNDALILVGERKLASLTESREPRRALDDVYDNSLKYCLEQGFWNFAIRAVQVDSSASVTPTFGFSFAFTKPDDWIRTVEVADNETFIPQLTGHQFVDEPNYWFAESDPLYIRYISNDTAYGGDLSIWPETFANYVAHRLANRICKRVTGKDVTEEMKRDEKRALADARSKDAMNEGPRRPPTGSWVNSRGASLNRDIWNKTFQ